MQVEVILLEKIGNRQVGDIARVKRGFANYLVRFHKARRATKQAKIEFEQERAELLKRAAEKLAQAEVLATKLASVSVSITQQAGVDGRLFGSVGTQDIASQLQERGFEINKTMVKLPEGPLKVVGLHAVSIALHADVSAEIQVQIIGEAV
jgi:large subunit ribosomal protein L9